jgi:c-di-GMP-binding flagellar brake protein YcgR
MQLASESALAIGQRLEIAIDRQWWPTRLEDHQADARRLTLAWPMDAMRSLLPLEVGQTVELFRVVSGDGAYSAICRVDDLQKGAVSLISVTLVEDWQRSQRRHAVRAEVVVTPRLAEAVSASGVRRNLRLGIVDVSASGVQVRSQDEIGHDDLLELAFALSGEIHVRARVRRVVRNENVWEAGCAFEGISEALSQQIVQFIFARQRALLRAQRGSR